MSDMLVRGQLVYLDTPDGYPEAVVASDDGTFDVGVDRGSGVEYWPRCLVMPTRPVDRAMSWRVDVQEIGGRRFAPVTVTASHESGAKSAAVRAIYGDRHFIESDGGPYSVHYHIPGFPGVFGVNRYRLDIDVAEECCT